MKTLVYFASGPVREKYHELSFDRIYLIDNIFKKYSKRKESIYQVGKIFCVGMDCLDSIQFLRKENVKIDYFVSLNEGLHEGGGSYAINSDVFLGYVMPLLKDDYVHIMDQSYYGGMHHVTMDLPYIKKELHQDDINYIDPAIFRAPIYLSNAGKVFQMKKNHHQTSFMLKNNIKVSIIQDSIWNFYECLDCLFVSFGGNPSWSYFQKFDKVSLMDNLPIESILSECASNKLSKIGFTPWSKGSYTYFLELSSNLEQEFPTEIYLFHLNRKDYKKLKEELK